MCDFTVASFDANDNKSSFPETFSCRETSDTPAFIAEMQARYGGDTANVRWQKKNAGGIEVLIAQEQSKDSEVSHTTEVVGYMAFEKKTADSSVTAVFGGTPDADHPGTVQDTFININNEVNAASAQLNTYTWPSKTPANAVLMKFDLSALPKGAQVQSATLQLYQTTAKGDDPYTVSVHRVINHNPDLNWADGYTYDGINNWTANDDSYKGIPLAQADIARAEDENDLDQVPGYKEWNVTGMVQRWVSDPDSNYGLMLNSDAAASANSYRYFASADAMASQTKPKLKVVYTLPTQTVIFGDTPDADYSGTIEDTFININEEVNASNSQLNTYTWPENTPANAILLKFDLSTLPKGARIQRAALKLYQSSARGDSTYDVSVHKIINHEPDLHQANGYTYDGINSWSPSDVCYNSTPLAQADIGPAVDVNALNLNNGYKEWDVTNMIQNWVSGAALNYGLLLNSDGMASADSHRKFTSSEGMERSQRPLLEILYTTPQD